MQIIKYKLFQSSLMAYTKAFFPTGIGQMRYYSWKGCLGLQYVANKQRETDFDCRAPK